MPKEPIAQLSHSTIGRSRVVGRTKLGLPKEETIPAVRGLYQYDRDGNRVHTSTHSHRAFVKHFDDAVKPRVVKDLLEAGFLEEGVCPYTPRESLDNRPPAEPPPGFNERCDGKGTYSQEEALGGCAHLKAIVRERRGLARERALQRKPPARAQQDLNAVVAAVMAAMKAEGKAPPAEDEIAKLVARVLTEQQAAVLPPIAVPVPEVSAAAGKAALAAARERTKNTQGEAG